ncbi:MAG: hypothetical protein Q8Q29_08595, partial [Actinomycetota bacterium]|nr:hypothetical protein [Actinomycetota bacterium]
MTWSWRQPASSPATEARWDWDQGVRVVEVALGGGLAASGEVADPVAGLDLAALGGAGTPPGGAVMNWETG